ncbi:hypothetical protein EB796_007967 [Bugula neritina]|uniref:Uncharacterized protein n=1 Tax=Bugula neritina TaxID=10212 RepID=A0A7J7K697_BUGNE|nr:hypothetical protein EB796_007967 [Bugula neritina]
MSNIREQEYAIIIEEYIIIIMVYRTGVSGNIQYDNIVHTVKQTSTMMRTRLKVKVKQISQKGCDVINYPHKKHRTITIIF